MDPELKAFTRIGELQKIKQNFRETQTRLVALERSNRQLAETVRALESRLNGISTGSSSHSSALNEEAEQVGRGDGDKPAN